MEPTISIQAFELGKCYQIYAKPIDRLKQSLWRGRKIFYRDFWALKNATFTIHKGETVGIIGSNGSGKSTLLQLICGILAPTVGQINVNGKITALLELGSGFNPEFTGRENVFMSAAIMGLSQSEIEEKYDEIIAFADIGEFINQPVKNYSSGMYVRLAFATAITVSPDIFVVDEALAVGDVRFQRKCIGKIKKFCETGTVIFVSHDTTTVLELCSRVIWIEGGEVRMDGIPKLVVEKYLQYMYEGDNKNKPNSEEPLHATAAPRDLSGFSVVGSNLRQFGNRKAVIEGIQLLSQGSSNICAYAGQPCDIRMMVRAYEDIERPIVGYIVKDRLGREILGENTASIRQSLPYISKGKRYLVTFKIETWPNLQGGDYFLSISIADGSIEEHDQCHYVYDAIVFKSIHLHVPAGMFSVINTAVVIDNLGP